MNAHHDAGRGLLDLARDILEGRADVPMGQRTRAAAQLTRVALEEIVSDQCVELGASLPRASMRSRLIVLHVLAPPTVSRPARAAWEGLSRACHRHAYELAPADGEISALIDQVAELGGRERGAAPLTSPSAGPSLSA
jgi:hypothetical protein